MLNLNYLTDEPSLFGAATPENFALLEEGRGPLTSNIPEAAGFFRTRDGLEAPDVEFHFAPSMLYDQGLTAPEAGGMAFGPVVIHPVEPRPGDAARTAAGLQAPRADELPHHRGGLGEHARGTADGARDRRAGARCARSSPAPSGCRARTPRPTCASSPRTRR